MTYNHDKLPTIFTNHFSELHKFLAINLSFLEFIKNHHQKLHNLKGTKYLLIKSPYIHFCISFYFHFSTFIPPLSCSSDEFFNFHILSSFFLYVSTQGCCYLFYKTFITIPPFLSVISSFRLWFFMFIFFMLLTLDISSYPIWCFGSGMDWTYSQ